MGNAVGPVALVAAGIYLGYLVLTGRAANLVAFLSSGGTSVAPAASSSSGTYAPSSATLNANRVAGAYGDNLSGSGSNPYSPAWNPLSAYSAPSAQTQLLNALQQSAGGVSTGSYVPGSYGSP